MAAHAVVWDRKHKRPIVDGKLLNPKTGVFEGPNQSMGFWFGPSAVDVIWHNVGPSDYLGARAPFFTSIDHVLIEVANHVRNEVYRIVSVSASAYSYTIVCDTTKTQAEVFEAMSRMRDNIYGPRLPPPTSAEELAEFAISQQATGLNGLRRDENQRDARLR